MLSFLEQIGLSHKNVCANNIMISEKDKSLKLVDLGGVSCKEYIK